ncbi:MAG TPA: copper chaperone PCu(A)C [Ilumatobacter sp.]|nr:copper chaperone PCu(A)C [Ilumatobacter sp.]
MSIFTVRFPRLSSSGPQRTVLSGAGTRRARQTTWVAMHRLAVGLGLTLATVLGTAGCGDSDETTDGLTASAAWARPSPGGATSGAVYATLVAGADDSIMSASVPASLAADAQFHETVPASGADAHDMDGDGDMMMTMREVERIDLVAGETFEFAPGATHIMIFDLVEPLTLGQEFTVELQLESGGSVPVDVVVADTAPTE